MTDRMPADDVVGPAARTGEWVCPRCGRENKATWTQCPACESDRAGRTPTERAPVAPAPRTNPIYLLIGLLVLAVLVIAAVLVAEPVWEWVVEQWDTFIAWVDART
jgi:hypothetical protein